MWSIFILPVALFAAGSALLGTANVGAILTVTLAADLWQRRRGHKPGEGVFTERDGGHVYGLHVSEDGTDLGQFLHAMVETFPEMFKEFEGKAFDLTVTEGEDLRAMVQVAQEHLNKYLEINRERKAHPRSKKILVQLRDQGVGLEKSLVPVMRYLRGISAARIKDTI